MANALYPATIGPTIEEYKMENILRAQRDEITAFGKFLKNLVKKYRLIEIHPYYVYKYGFAYKKEARMKYLDYFPDMNNPKGEQKFVLDGDNLGAFKDDYKKLLGGLLIDYQIFLISSKDEQGNTIYLCAFNLLDGAIGEGFFKSQGTRPWEFVYAPIIQDNTFDKDLYDTTNPDSLVNIMNAFLENEVLLGYQRIGNRPLERKEREYPVWIYTCTSMPYIEYAF